MLLVLLAVTFRCRCSNCSGSDRCTTMVGCFTINNYTTGGTNVIEKGCFGVSEVYRVKCTNSTQRVACCKQDMCNDFTISDEGNGKALISPFV